MGRYYWVLRGTRIVCELCCNAGAGAAELIAAELTPGTVPGSSATADKPTIEAAARASTAEAELLAKLDLEEPEAGAGSGSGSATGKPKDKPKGKPKAQRGKRTTVSSEPRFITFTFAWLNAVLLVLAVAGFWCLHWGLHLLGRVEPRELLGVAWLFR